jgi:hypothetical protein
MLRWPAATATTRLLAPSIPGHPEVAPVNRLLILVALLAVFLAACGTEQSSESQAVVTPEPTPEATPDAPEPSEEPAPSDEPAASEDGGGTGSLDDVIPDELNGVAGTPIPGMEQILGAALQGQGLDASDAEFAFVTYGSGTDATVLNAFRIPGMTDVAMEQLARVMSGAGVGQDVDVETLNVGGKTVLSFSGGATDGAIYFYVADDVAFTIAGQNEGLVEQLVTELP